MAILKRIAVAAALTALLLIAWRGLVRGPDAAGGPLPQAARETAVTLERPAEPLAAAAAIDSDAAKTIKYLFIINTMSCQNPQLHRILQSSVLR